MPTNYDKLFNQAQGNELIGVLRGIKTAIGKNIGEVTLTENGEYLAEDLGYDSISDITVEVPNTYDASDEGKVVNNGNLVSQSSTTKTSNGTYDTTLNDEVVINVPNTYSASDEGKVVDNGALVAQTSQNISQNGTYDTTLKNEVVVDVAGGGGGGGIIHTGTNTPSSSLGSNGDIFIKYSETPSGYTGLDYIETTGTQYIDLDVPANSVYGCRFEFMPKAIAASTYQSYLSGTVDNFTVGCYNTLNNIYIRRRGSQIGSTHNVSTTEKNILEIKGTKVSLNGSLISTITADTLGTDNSHIVLSTAANNISSRLSSLDFYGLEFYDTNGNTVNKFVPMKRNSDDEIGVYDIINDVFYDNDGTGNIVAGNELPAKMIHDIFLKVDGAWEVIEGQDFDDIDLASAVSLGSKTVTQNGTYYASDDLFDGYDSVTVNVSGGGGINQVDIVNCDLYINIINVSTEAKEVIS